MLNGYGRHIRIDNNHYIGHWKDDKYEGQGQLVLVDAKYNGDFKNGMLNGFITKTAKNGAVIYQGMYLNNRKNGAGKLILEG